MHSSPFDLPAPGRSPPNDAGRAFMRQITPVPRSQPVTCFWSAVLTTANVSRQHEWPRADINRPEKKKFSIHFIFFYFLCLKKKIPNSKFRKKKNSNFEFQNLKKKKKHLWDIFFDLIFMSRDWAKPLSHRTEIPSQDHVKIRAFQSLTRNPRHWAMI